MPTQIMVASAFIHKDGKVLIAKRAASKSFLPDRWEVPGGQVEFGESIEVAIAREIQEEIHVDIVVGDPFYTFTYLPEPDIQGIEVDCFATLTDSSQEIILNPEDHSEYTWISEAEIDTYFPADDWTGKALKRDLVYLRANFCYFFSSLKNSMEDRSHA